MKPTPLLDFPAAKRYLLAALCKQSLCSAQIRQRLKRREVPEEMVEELLDEVIRLGFVDDKLWVESFIRRQQARHDGPMTIKHKLRAKGVEVELIDELLPRDESLQRQQILELLKGRYRKFDLSDFKQRQKAIAALARKGFNLDLILQVTNVE